MEASKHFNLQNKLFSLESLFIGAPLAHGCLPPGTGPQPDCSPRGCGSQILLHIRNHLRVLVVGCQCV